MLPSNNVSQGMRELGSCLVEREGWLSYRASHLLFVALDRNHHLGDGWTFQGAVHYSTSQCDFKDPVLVAATSVFLCGK